MPRDTSRGANGLAVYVRFVYGEVNTLGLGLESEGLLRAQTRGHNRCQRLSVAYDGNVVTTEDYYGG